MERRGSYGIDAPGSLFGLTLGGLVLLIVAVVDGVLGAGLWGVLGPLLGAAVVLANAGLFWHTSRRGKFEVWDGLLNALGLRGGERVLDLGCGRGAVLLAVAKRLPRGRAVGVDLWRTTDQSGNAEAVTRRNAEAEGVSRHVDLYTGDLTALPFPDDAFDVVLSSLAIHNIRPETARLVAVEEAVRVLRPGGRLLIADIMHASDYARRLRDAGMDEVREQGLGWRFWFGGPWMATTLVTATAPARPEERR